MTSYKFTKNSQSVLFVLSLDTHGFELLRVLYCERALGSPNCRQRNIRVLEQVFAGDSLREVAELHAVSRALVGGIVSVFLRYSRLRELENFRWKVYGTAAIVKNYRELCRRTLRLYLRRRNDNQRAPGQPSEYPSLWEDH